MLIVQQVSRTFGKQEAVKDLTFSLQEGEIFGLLGPNGAGKTTTIKMITGMLRLSSGQITLDGVDIEKDSVNVKQQIGYVPDRPVVFDRLTGREFIDFMGKLHHVRDAFSQVIPYAKLFEMDDGEIDDPTGNLPRRILVDVSHLFPEINVILHIGLKPTALTAFVIDHAE